MVDGLWKNEQSNQSSGGSVIEIHLLVVANGEERKREVNLVFPQT